MGPMNLLLCLLKRRLAGVFLPAATLLGASLFISCAATYYVDSVAGDDAGSGTEAGQAWRSLGRVNAQTFQAGDRILLKADPGEPGSTTTPSISGQTRACRCCFSPSGAADGPRRRNSTTTSSTWTVA
jgi:hypothetical protein